ncbi:para-aminobenzoate synthase [Scheffersomyces amazonensis]|uniref:para-aminobenzoate synthase n=1 Tax=Scheffersomyces amazonensis TaxID=1078765 RepID=UPI00315CC6EA
MILLIDSYDSFTNNLASLLRQTTHQKVITIHNDAFPPDQYDTFYNDYLSYFDFMVIGPGPGHPANDDDVGIIKFLFEKFKYAKQAQSQSVIPVLGICLGFQCMCYSFGNDISRLSDVRHGQVYDIIPDNDIENLLFNDSMTGFGNVRYHSLYVDEVNDEIIPLAYCYDNDSKVLMAARHSSLPFYGVQYHPESICSTNGEKLVRNFSKIAYDYNQKVNRTIKGHSDESTLPQAFSSHTVHEDYLIPNGIIENKSNTSTDPDIYLKKFQLNNDIDPTDICDYFNRYHEKFFLLNSASIPGEWSIIGLPVLSENEIITHSVDALEVHINVNGNHSTLPIKDKSEVWKLIGSKIKEKYIPRSDINTKLGNYHERDLPFFGGYLGLISYEEGQHVILEQLESICNGNTPDLKLIYIDRFMVYDHTTHDWFVVSIRPNDSEWCESIYTRLTQAEDLKLSLDDIPSSVKDYVNESDQNLIKFEFPSRDIYNQQFAQCQDYLHSGDSYELCLTTQSKITLPSYVNAWDIYKVLTLRKNPSPFSCFMDFEDCVIISSSPERFLSWKNTVDNKKQVELRPIKGTVKNTPEVDIVQATKILKTPKEMGENLMIVDLIRHDLYQFTEQVDVTQLMAVEEYKTVYQLVSVIQGQLSKQGYHGIDVLHSSLPPGSMTGAPKKRSVELLQRIESMQTTSTPNGRRGIYSGVVGYWSVTDEADWSVIIRSVFHYADDKENTDQTKIWRIGAGGAITVLSKASDEWEEMELKLVSALQAFK